MQMQLLLHGFDTGSGGVSQYVIAKWDYNDPMEYGNSKPNSNGEKKGTRCPNMKDGMECETK
jgi:hypothetical protein